MLFCRPRITVGVTWNNYSKLFKTFKTPQIEQLHLKTHKFKQSKYQFTYLIKSWLLRGLCPVSMKSSHKVTELNGKCSRGYLCPVHLTNQHSPVLWRAWLTTNDILVCFSLVNSIGNNILIGQFVTRFQLCNQVFHAAQYITWL